MNVFPRLNVELFTKLREGLSAEASDLGFRPGERPHGRANGVNVGGKGYFLERETEFGWTYRHPIDCDTVEIYND